MAEARSEEEEDNMMRDNREQVVRRSAGGRPDRRKPEHRLSHGPLSSIRAAIKRTSTRSTSVSEPSRERERDRERERERDRERDRRRPEITILSAEPLSSTSWFPGASAGFPPPPPPAAQIWGPTIPPSVQPPPSYEEVIREKTQEQVLLPPPPSSCSSSSSPRPASSITIATQTDPGPAPDPEASPARKPVRPPRPPRPSHVDDITVAASRSSPDLLAELCPPLTSTSGAQTDRWDPSFAAVDVATPPAASSRVPSERPRPRPRTRLDARPVDGDVRVQTLVKLREDGAATLLLAARAGATADQEAGRGTYLQELLEAFGDDDWGFPDRRSDSGEDSQSESEDEDDDMATLKARIQAFEQQQQQGADGSGGDGGDADFVVAKRPEPRPRPRLQGQPAKSVPPAVAPKPKNLSQAPKPSSKGFWEDGSSTDSSRAEAQTATEPTVPPKSAPASGPCKTAEKPSVAPKPQSATDPLLQSGSSAPVPAPRPAPPKLASSVSEPANAKPPPRPPVAPRASLGAPHRERSATAGRDTPTLPPRPSVEVGGPDETLDNANQTVKVGSVRPGVPTKPAALTSPRRASAPNLAPKPAGASPPTPPDPNPAVPSKPTAAAAASPAPRPSAPAPALRKGPVIQTRPEPTPPTQNPSDPPLPPRPSSAKLLPLRPPPIKSSPGRPPPPAVVGSASSANQTTPPPPSRTSPAPSVSSPAGRSSPSQTTTTPPSPVPANQTQPPRASKRGPPLPPRPKPGHPLYTSYVKQEVLIVLDDPSPSEHQSGEGRSQTAVIDPSQSLLDLDPRPEPAPDQDGQSKASLGGLGLSDAQSILPVQPSEPKEQPDPPAVSGPRCVALFDYEGEEDDELTFSQGDVIALLELIGQEWGRGQIHGRVGVFPLNFAEVLEPPAPAAVSSSSSSSSSSPDGKPTSTENSVTESTAPKTSQDPDSEEAQEEQEQEAQEAQEEQEAQWAEALFDFPGQTADDLSFHKGAIIRVTEHIDAQWRRGRVEGREGIYPAAFTQACQAQPITDQQSAVKGVAKFDFTAESEDELTLKVGDAITQVEFVDEQWILGVVGGRRGIVPKNYISLL